jgi:cyanophycinase
VTTTGGAFLEGGRSDKRPGWAWFLDHAGNGDIVVICSTCDNLYAPYVFNTHTVNSVQTLRLTKRIAASDPFVVSSVAGADGIFIAGGDQSDYVRIWKDTPVEDAINADIQRGVPVGGISAGLAVLGQFLFSAVKNTVTSDRALLNCYGHKITVRRDMLSQPLLANTITDSHFTQRDRMGRLLVFMSRILTDGWATQVRGIGVDEGTAVLVEPDGSATLVGHGTASFLEMDPSDVHNCSAGNPLEAGPVQVQVVTRDGSFDLSTWTGNVSVTRTVRASGGSLIWS